TNQILKSFTNIKDFQSGADIHETYLSHIEKNSFTIASPIHFYMQCEDVNRAEQIYNKSKKNTMDIYGAMRKGLIVVKI
ncbi:unnamed protein product, partial [Rotaria sordida]